MTFDASIFTDNWAALASGFATTMLTWIAGVLLGLAIGFIVAVVQLFFGRPLRILLRAYVEVVRGTPFLVQLFILYYGGPFIGLDLQPLTAGIVGLGIYGSAYFAEVFRTGFLSVPKGQLEAAACLGVTRSQMIRRIQLPQMLVVITPALVNLVIILSKETAVLSIITVPELTLVVTGIGSATYAFVETTLILALCYWALVEATSRIGRAVETKVGRFMVRA